jgi:peptidoglycan/LPS O-acetylase OafA/YrhL
MGLVRLLLAIVVAAGHWQLLILSQRGVGLSSHAMLNAAHAVLFFYAISGYLITYTLSRNYERSRVGVAHFYANRFIRIFALYWPMVALVLITSEPARLALWNAKWVDKFTGLFLFGVDWRWSFGKPGGQYISSTLPSLSQAWTLGAELTFYLLAPVLMWRRGLAVALLLGSLALRIVFIAVLKLEPQDLWIYTFFPSTILFFLMGHFAAKAGEYYPALATPRIGIALVALCFLDMAFVPEMAFDDVRSWTAMLLFTAGLPGLFSATKRSVLLNWLGDLSYPVYLVHLLVITLFGKYLADFTTHLADGKMLFGLVSTALFVSTVMVASIIAHYLLEDPLSRALHAVASKLPKPQREIPASRT